MLRGKGLSARGAGWLASAWRQPSLIRADADRDPARSSPPAADSAVLVFPRGCYESRACCVTASNAVGYLIGQLGGGRCLFVLSLSQSTLAVSSRCCRDHWQTPRFDLNAAQRRYCRRPPSLHVRWSCRPTPMPETPAPHRLPVPPGPASCRSDSRPHSHRERWHAR